MASLLSWVGKKIKGGAQTINRDVVHPVTNVVSRDVVAPVSHAVGNTVNAGATAARDIGGAAQATGRFVMATPKKNVVAPFVGSLAKGFAQQGAALGRSTYDIGRGAAADITHNPVALANANKAKARDNPIVLAPFTRPVVQIARSVEHPFTSNSYVPKSPEAKRIFGDAPVQNLAAGAKSNFDAHKNLPLPQRIALSTAYTGGQVAQDALLAAGAKKTGTEVAKSTVKTARAAQDVATGKPFRHVTDPELAAVSRVAKARNGYGDAIAQVQPNDVAVYRHVQRKLGVDANNHGAIDQLIGARMTYDTKMSQRAPVFQHQGGGFGTEDVGKSGKSGGLLPNAEANVFAQNPLDASNGYSQMGQAVRQARSAEQPVSAAQVLKSRPIQSTSSPKDASLPNNTPLPEVGVKKVPFVDKAFRSTRSVIERQGEHGKKLASMLQASRDTQEIYQAQIAKQLPTVRKLKGKVFENFVEATQGQAKPMNDKVVQAIREWQTVHPEIRQRAIQAGLDVGDLGPNYYPHFVDYEKVFKDTNTFNKAINYIVETGQAPDQEAAIKLLNYARDVSRNREFGNLEASRLVDIPFYDKTPNSLISYIGGSAKRISQTETFGKQDEKALQLITKAGSQGYDTEAMKNAYDIAVGARKYNPTSQKISNAARGYLSTTRLGLGALTNSSQNVNTGIVTGHFRTMGAMLKQLNPKTRSFVADTGVIGDAVLNDIKQQTGFVGKSLSKITAPGFNKVEQFNRSVAATAGRDYGLRLAQKGDEATLRKLGVTGPIKNRTLTEAQQVQVARKVVEKTQFKVDAQDLPGWADSPGGKLVAQFRTFSYNQSKFFSNEILKPVARGNLLPLSRLLAALPVGYALYETKRKIANRQEESNPLRKGTQVFSNVGGAGLALDIFNGVFPLNGKTITPDRRVSMAAGTFGGPLVGTATELVGALSQAGPKATGGAGDPKQLERFGLRQIPIVGTTLQNSLVPYTTKVQAGGQTIELKPKEADALHKLEDTKYKDLENKVKQQSGFTDLSPEDQKKKLQNAKEDVAAIAKSQILTDINRGDVKIKLSAKQKQLLDGKTPNYVTTTRQASATKNTTTPAEKYKSALDTYNKNKAKMSDVAKYAAEKGLAKMKVQAPFSSDVISLYGMSKTEATNYLSSHPNSQKLADQVVAYDQALYKAGIISKPKYSTGTVAKGTSGRKSSGGGKASVSKLAGVVRATSKAKPIKTAKNPHIKVGKGSKVAYQKAVLKKYAVKSPTKIG